VERNVYQRMALFLSQQNQLASGKTAELAYGLEILFINGMNLLLTILIGFFLGVLPGTIACIIVAAAYRHTAGGAHSRSPWICAIATMIIFPTLACLGNFLSNGPPYYSYTIITAAALIGYYAVHFYAPVDSPQAPIISPQRRQKLKKYSSLVVSLLVLSLILMEAMTKYWLAARGVQLAAALTLIWVSFNLSDAAASFWYMLDNQHNSKNRR
jgi:accessory gene regulator B